MNKLELTGDVPDGRDADESIGVVIARTKLLLSLTLTLVGETTALDLARTEAVTLGPHGWSNPHRADDEPTE